MGVTSCLLSDSRSTGPISKHLTLRRVLIGPVWRLDGSSQFIRPVKHVKCTHKLTWQRCLLPPTTKVCHIYQNPHSIVFCVTERQNLRLAIQDMPPNRKLGGRLVYMVSHTKAQKHNRCTNYQSLDILNGIGMFKCNVQEVLAGFKRPADRKPNTAVDVWDRLKYTRHHHAIKHIFGSVFHIHTRKPSSAAEKKRRPLFPRYSIGVVLLRSYQSPHVSLENTRLLCSNGYARIRKVLDHAMRSCWGIDTVFVQEIAICLARCQCHWR